MAFAQFQLPKDNGSTRVKFTDQRDGFFGDIVKIRAPEAGPAGAGNRFSYFRRFKKFPDLSVYPSPAPQLKTI
jgi:hypothetical protein